MLASISPIPGVVAAAVFHGQDECVAEAVQPPYDTLLLSEAIKSLSASEDCFAGVGLHQPKLTLARCQGGVVVVAQNSPFYAVVVAGPDVNLTMLRVGLNVAVLKAKKAMLGAAAASAGAPRASFSANGPGSGSMGAGGFDSIASTEMAIIPPIDASAHADRSVGSSSRGSRSIGRPSIGGGEMSWGERSRRPRGAVGMKVMRHVLRVYQRYTGNDARRLLERELVDLGATPASLTVPQFADLIRRAAAHVADPVDRRQFLSEALGDRGR